MVRFGRSDDVVDGGVKVALASISHSGLDSS